MKIKRSIVEDTAKLARLKFTEEELKKFEDDMTSILSYIEMLNEINTEDIEPTINGLHFFNAFREDVVVSSLKNEDATKNSVDTVDGYFRVPKVIDGGGGA